MFLPAATAPLPVVRAAVFVLLQGTLGLAAHHLTGNPPAGAGHLAVVAAGLFALGLVGAGVRPSQPAALASGVLGQGLLHVVLRSGAGHGASAAGHEPGSAAHDVWHARVASWPGTSVAHVLAALIVAAVLCRADGALVRAAKLLGSVAERLRARLPGPCPALPTPQGPVTDPVLHLVRLPTGGRVLRGTVVRRGP
ncbi:hypothetical protein ACF07U_16205 [Streptomyces californicus]|uniref:hypothetical protein n=1 Tax=Streptomyces californicus TaxID=67351 RepID=UPI0036FA844A